MRFIATALSSTHTRANRSRFNPGPLLHPADQFGILYFADDPIVAAFEVGAMLGTSAPGGHVPHPRFTLTALNVEVILHDVADLTDVAAAQTPLGTNVQELTGDWDGYAIRHYLTPVSTPTGMAPTQILGKALFHTGIEGFRSISAKVTHHRILAVFPDNLRRGSSLTFRNDAGAIVHQIAP